MTIRTFTPGDSGVLCDLLIQYFPEVDSDIPDHIIRGKLLDLIVRQTREGLIHIFLAEEDGQSIGFSICQIDRPESDWCKRPGWGFIREFYIHPDFRRRGLGSQLARHTETALKNLGAERLYLTSGTAKIFWQSCGWHLTGETCTNDLPVLEK